VWDDDAGANERVGTFVVRFPDEKDRVKQDARWANMYGPFPGISGEKADYMSKFSDFGMLSV